MDETLQPKRRAGTLIIEVRKQETLRESTLRLLKQEADGFCGRAVTHEFLMDYATSPTSYIYTEL
jgi:hypothetical protein